MLGHIALSDAANLLLPRQGSWINWSQTRWQRNEFGSGSAYRYIGNSSGRTLNILLKPLDRGGQRQGSCTSLEEVAAVEHGSLHYDTASAYCAGAQGRSIHGIAEELEFCDSGSERLKKELWFSRLSSRRVKLNFNVCLRFDWLAIH